MIMSSQITKEQFAAANDLIGGAKRMLIVAHQDPDGDAVGAILAMAHYVRSLGKDCALYLYDKPPRYLSFLPGFDEIQTSLPAQKFDLVVALDYGNFWRLHLGECIDEATQVLTIDHHQPSDHKGKVMLIDKDADSTCEILLQFFRENGLPISNEIAACIFCGIVTDTGVFQYSNTRISTFENVVALLKEYTFDWERIIRESIYCERSTRTLKLWARILDRIEKDEHSVMAYTYVLRQDFKDFKLSFSDTIGLIDLIKTSSDVKFIMFLKDMHEDSVIEASFRSDEVKNYDVARLAMKFGGGGHKFAAGFRMKGTIQEVVEKVKKEIAR